MSSLTILRPMPFEIAHMPQILAGLNYESIHGVLPASRFWQQMEFRHDLNPVRFDAWHPTIANVLEGRTTFVHSTLPHRWIGHMRGPTAPVLPPGHTVVCPELPVLQPQVIPEPTSAMMIILGMIGVWLFK